MQTIKLPYTTSDVSSAAIRALLKEFSPVVRSAYSRFMEGKTELEVRNYLRSIFLSKDSWFLQSCIYDARGMATVDTNQGRSRIFGSKKAFIARREGKITSSEFKELRLLPLTSVGEATKSGNRKFSIDIEDNSITFKVNGKTHIHLELPRLRKNYSKLLKQVAILCEEKVTPVTFKIDLHYIYISFDETKLGKTYKVIPTRHAGIDMNPNYIGFVIWDKDVLVFSKMYDLTALTHPSGGASTSSKSKKATNKLHHEIYEIGKDITALASQYQVNIFSIEDLKMKSKDNKKGRSFNRLVNNKWNRNKLKESIIKGCALKGIICKCVNPAYSSYIGNLIHRDLPDPLAAASEVARRGYEVYILKKKGAFYPPIPMTVNETLRILWKDETAFIPPFKNWIEVGAQIKNAKMKYRVPIPKSGFTEFKCAMSGVTCLHVILHA